MTKTAIVLFNLGGPDSRDAIRPFLKNFFMDKNIIQAPLPVRMLVSALIARKRSGREAGNAYAQLGYKSPLLENTRLQSAALERAVIGKDPANEWKTFIAMRYWHPMSAETAAAVKTWSPDKIVLIPLYPQFSTTTTGSSIEAWIKAANEAGLKAPTTTLCCYPMEEGFITASAKLVAESYLQTQIQSGLKPRVLFSAHGLPEKIIATGDPYQWQCEESAKAIAVATGIPDLDWQICYQSRVGPLKWIGPSTEEALQDAAADNVPVVIYPHAFVSEHVETLVEIEIEYRHLAEALGVPAFMRVPTVSTQADFIAGLADQAIMKTSQTGISSNTGGRICPGGLRRCCQNQKIEIFK